MPEKSVSFSDETGNPGYFVQDISMALRVMVSEDIDEILAIETRIFPFPWARSGFLSSIYNGYDCRVMYDEISGKIAGYSVLMPSVDEAHLLTIGLKPSLQGMGYGRILLDYATGTARARGMTAMLLEVRPSNLSPLAMYQNYGFTQIGLRKDYYPDVGNLREDAIVMRYLL